MKVIWDTRTGIRCDACPFQVYELQHADDLDAAARLAERLWNLDRNAARVIAWLIRKTPPVTSKQAAS